jgi:hypothetical protein
MKVSFIHKLHVVFFTSEFFFIIYLIGLSIMKKYKINSDIYSNVLFILFYIFYTYKLIYEIRIIKVVKDF